MFVTLAVSIGAAVLVLAMAPTVGTTRPAAPSAEGGDAVLHVLGSDGPSRSLVLPDREEIGLGVDGTTPWGAPVGSRFVYRFSARTVSDVVSLAPDPMRSADETAFGPAPAPAGETGSGDSGEAAAAPGTVLGVQRLVQGVEGSLHVAVVGRDDEGFVTCWWIDDGDVVLQGPDGAERDSPTFAEALAEPMLVRCTRDGRVVGVHFAQGRRCGPDRARWMRSVVAAMRCVGRFEKRYVVDEEDVSGSATFEYSTSWEPERAEEGTLQVRREKLRQLYVEGAGDPVDLGYDSRCHGTVVFDRALGWAVASRWRENTAVAAIGGARLEVAIRMSAELVDHGSVDLAVVSEQFGRTADVVWASAAGVPEADLDAAARAVEESAWRQGQLGGATTMQLFDEVSAALRQHGLGSNELWVARERLSWKLLEDPESATRDLAMLVGASLGDQDLVDVALSAAGAAGHEPAQAFLCSLMQDAGAPEAARLSALAASFQVAQPTLDLVEQAAGFARRGEGDFQSTGTLLLGKLAGGDGVGAEAASARLAEMEPSEPGPARDRWLLSVANGGPEAARPHLDEYARSSNPALREVAIEGFARASDESSAVRLVEFLDRQRGRRGDQIVAALARRSDDHARDGLVRIASGATRARARARLSALDALAERARRGDTESLRALQQSARAAGADADATSAAIVSHAQRLLQGM